MPFSWGTSSSDARCGLRVARYELRVTGCGLRVASYGFCWNVKWRMTNVELRNSIDFNKLFNDGAKRLP
jgi:hypothetical protein